MMLNKIVKLIRSIVISIVFGLKNTEEDILKQKASSLSASNSSEQKIQQNQLAENLLKGEITEEVEILRDRTYFVCDESKKYKVIIDTVGTTKAFKYSSNIKIPKIYNVDDSKIKIIIDNQAIPSSVIDGLNAVNGYGIKNIYPLNFTYDNLPKFQLNQYISKLVVRVKDDSTFIDLYVPVYTDSFERLYKLFDNEINSVINKTRKIINLEFNTVEFISNKSYGVEDLCKFKYEMIKLISISKFDNKNVLTYEVKVIENGNKITDKYINKKLRNNYEKKSSRNQVIDLTTPNKKVSKCDKCGCDMESEYDYRITKSSVGIGLCNKCLSEYNNKL